MATKVSTTTYVAEVERDESGAWIASVPALRGVHTHARTLSSLRRYLQDAVALWLEVGLLDAGESDPHVDRESIEVELHIALPPPVQCAADSALKRREQARSAETDAAIATRDAARILVESGLSRRDAAEVLGLSHQRVDQLLHLANRTTHL